MAVRHGRSNRNSQPCPECHGTRKVASTVVPGEMTTCLKCNGRGRVPVRPKDAIDRLYDGFVKKDMGRQEFREAYLRLTSPAGLRRDLASMAARLQMGRVNKDDIERGLKRS